MKLFQTYTGMVIVMTASLSMHAQKENLVVNGSFEQTSGKIQGRGGFAQADSISSANNTTVDLYSKTACGRDYDVPVSYMGNQDARSGNAYAGIIAYYADDCGIFTTEPGYRKYSEYIQFP